MHQEAKNALRIRLALAVLEYARHFGVTEACREFNVPRSTFYRWKQSYELDGQDLHVAASTSTHLASSYIDPVLPIPTALRSNLYHREMLP